MTTRSSVSISSAADRTAFAAANGWFERFLDGVDVPGEVRADLLVAFEELVVNVIRHAYGEAEGAIEISAERNDQGVTVTLLDYGPPFDPVAFPAPDLDRSIAQRPVGGLGIHLVRQLCDRIEYRRSGESNILVVTKAIRRSSGRDHVIGDQD